MGGTLMVTDCGAVPLRPIAKSETWWHNSDDRICGDCMQEVTDA